MFKEDLIIDKDVIHSLKRSSQAIGYLGGFLCCDVGNSIDLREWMNDKKQREAISVRSKLNNSIFIAFEIAYFNEHRTHQYLNYLLHK